MQGSPSGFRDERKMKQWGTFSHLIRNKGKVKEDQLYFEERGN